MSKFKIYCDQSQELLLKILKASNSIASFERPIKKDTAMKISYALIKEQAVELNRMELINLRNAVTRSKYAVKNPSCMILQDLTYEIEAFLK